MRSQISYAIVAAIFACATAHAQPSDGSSDASQTPSSWRDEVYIGAGDCIWTSNFDPHGAGLLTPVISEFAGQAVKTIAQALRDAAKPIHDVRTATRAIQPLSNRCIQVVSGDLDYTRAEENLAVAIEDWGWSGAAIQEGRAQVPFATHAARILIANGIPPGEQPSLMLEARLLAAGHGSDNKRVYVLDPTFVDLNRPWSRPRFRFDQGGEREIALTLRFGAAPENPGDKSATFAIRFGRRATTPNRNGATLVAFNNPPPSARASYARELANVLYNVEAQVVEDAPGSAFNAFWADVLGSTAVTNAATTNLRDGLMPADHEAARLRRIGEYNTARGNLATIALQCPAPSAENSTTWVLQHRGSIREALNAHQTAAASVGISPAPTMPTSGGGSDSAVAAAYAANVLDWCRGPLKSYLVLN